MNILAFCSGFALEVSLDSAEGTLFPHFLSFPRVFEVHPQTIFL